MKVIRIISELDFGGVEQVVANSVPEMINHLNIDVKVVVLGNGGRVEQELVRKGVEVIVLNQNPQIPNVKLLLALRKFLLQERPDVVHCQGAEANFHGILAGSWAGVKNILGEEIGIPNHHGYWRYIFRWVYSKANKIIAISEAVKSTIVGLGEVKETQVEVLYNPVRLPKKEAETIESTFEIGVEKHQENLKLLLDEESGVKTKPGNLLDKTVLSEIRNSNENLPFVFISTCRLVPVKNLDRLINAFSKVVTSYPQSSFELWLVGDGPLRIILENQSKDMGIAEKVRFLGFQNNVYQFLAKADVFVLPSLSEGSSVSLVEAMSMGLPSVVTKVGGAGEILGGSDSGILVDPLDEASIFEALSFFVTLSDNQKMEMGKRGAMEADRFSVDKYLEKLLAIYSDKID
jgi:glycosyltransferase involved in cell wall biosynthesis